VRRNPAEVDHASHLLDQIRRRPWSSGGAYKLVPGLNVPASTMPG